MASKYDVLIVGTGLFGATCANVLTEKGFRCLALEKRDHIGGNCFTVLKDGINIHQYGPHIFHTANKTVWNWINRFAEFNHYRHTIKVTFEGNVYSFPPNLNTYNELWGVKTPAEARQYLERIRRRDLVNLDSLENWILSRAGSELYEIFFKGYTEKQWGRAPNTLPAAIGKRIPLRFTYDDGYFDDPYQGIPIGGYTRIFERLLDKVEIRLNTDYLENRNAFDLLAAKTIYTGPIDRFYEYRFGGLEYRSVRFEHECLNIPDFQGVAQMNYSSSQVPYTRIIEHKHFEFGRQPVTWITREYPAASTPEHEEMYPVRDQRNLQILAQYRALGQRNEYKRFYFGGRLAEYQYYDMHQVISAALNKVVTIERDLRYGGSS